MNKVTLLGRLTRDPELRYTQTQKTQCTFSLAVNTWKKDEQGRPKAIFVRCVAWGRTAELIGNYVTKGQRLLIEGKLDVNEWTGKDGVRHNDFEVVVDNSEFIEPRKDSGQEPQASAPAPAQPVPFDEEVPF